MRTSLAFTALVASLTTVIAVPVSDGFIGKKAINAPPTSTNTTISGKDIILWFKTGDAAIEDSIKAALDYVKRSPEDDSVDVLRNSAFTAIIMKGVDPDDMDAFNAMDSIDVVEEDVTIRSFDQQPQAAWGLQRISNDAGASGNPQAQAFTYSFDGTAQNLGAGVDIYMVDTGIRTTHAVFQGRAVQGFPATGANDGDGHGTHTAGTAAGAKFGVAQGANLIAVKVLGDDGSGSSLDFIKGIDWAVNNHDARKTQPGFVGSVMSMSLGIGTRVDTVNRAVAEAVNRGIHVSVAAGNEGKDACGTTPASLGGANSNVVTVGAININNQVSTFSNIGTCVDIYAPGEQILSAWNAGDKVINFLSGTSMACPHVTGVMATLIAQDPAGLGQNPAALKAKLLATARQNAFTGNTGGSANLLLSNGVNGNVAPQGQQQRRTVTGDITSWAKDNLFIKNLGARWTVHSTDSPMRF